MQVTVYMCRCAVVHGSVVYIFSLFQLCSLFDYFCSMPLMYSPMCIYTLAVHIHVHMYQIVHIIYTHTLSVCLFIYLSVVLFSLFQLFSQFDRVPTSSVGRHGLSRTELWPGLPELPALEERLPGSQCLDVLCWGSGKDVSCPAN